MGTYSDMIADYERQLADVVERLEALRRARDAMLNENVWDKNTYETIRRIRNYESVRWDLEHAIHRMRQYERK